MEQQGLPISIVIFYLGVLFFVMSLLGLIMSLVFSM